MTPADLAKEAALSFECKKDSMRQNQSGDWKIAFTVQGIDVPDSLTKAFPGTRYMAVLVQIGDDEQPVSGAAAPAAGRSMAREQRAEQGNQGGAYEVASQDLPECMRNAKEASRDEPVLGKPRREWRDRQPSTQAGMRSGDVLFKAFLCERDGDDWQASGYDAAECIRMICGVESRKDLDTDHRARVIWHQLDEQFLTWKALERAS